MKKKYIFIGVLIGLLLLSAAVFLTAYLGSVQAMIAIFLPLQFQGEYSYDDGITWTPIEPDTSYSAENKSLLLRGHFDIELPAGTTLNFYLDHITMEMYADGEKIMCDSRREIGLIPSDCCRQWIDFVTPEITTEQEVVISLENFHRFGNKEAYNEFVSNIYPGTEERFSSFMLKTGKVQRVVGIFVVVVAVMLLAVSAAFRLLRIDAGSSIGMLGLIALLFGVYITMDTTDLSLWSTNNVVNTYGMDLCVMLLVTAAAIGAAQALQTGARKPAIAAAIASAAVNAVLLVLSLAGVMVIYDTAIYSMCAHMVIFPVMLVCCIYELVRRKKPVISVLSYAALFAAFIADTVNDLLYLYPSGACIKFVFLAVFLVNLVIIIKVIPANYRAAQNEKKLQTELADSRISIMLSQIQPHFLYNSLNSIYYLCDKDPQAAKKAISDFSDYMRGSMDSLTRKTPIPFYKELQHVRSYLTLEKMRFEDRLEIEWDIQTEDFMIPALTVQPLVENAVKHGVCQLEEGGTVKISTRDCGEHFEVEISDNGAGFDVNEVKNDGKSHVGIENVRSRLWKMCKAELEITSEKGKGTSAVIRIPK